MEFYEVVAAQGKQFYDGEFKPYPDLGALILGPDIPEDLCVEVVRGGRPGDMMFAAFGVASSRFVDVLARCGATGYVAHPIAVHNAERDNEPISGYMLVKLTGRGGRLNEDKMQLVRSPGGDAISDYSGIYMDESQWDGSDVFAIPGFGIGMYVVKPIAAALRRANLRNVRLCRNAECRIY